MKKIFSLIILYNSCVLAQLIQAPADCDIAMRLCDANVSYNFQLVDAGLVDDAYPSLGVPNLFKSSPNKWEAKSCFMKFTAKYSGLFGFTVCPETPEPLSYLFLANPVCENLETGAYSIAWMDLTALEEPIYGCRGMGDDPLINDPNHISAYSFPFQNLQAGSNYMIFVRIRYYLQPGSHRFTISFQGNAVTSHPDLFDNVACQLMATNELLVSKELMVFPNPFNDLINIKTNLSLEKTEIYDLLGKKVYNQNFSPEIDTAFLESGVYFLKMYAADNEVFVRRIVKK